MAPSPLAGGAVRRHLVCPRALDAVARRLPACDHRERRGARRAPDLHPAHGRRLETLRRAVWALRRRQPRDSAQLSELTLAAALPAPLRTGDLPVLPRARRTHGRT